MGACRSPKSRQPLVGRFRSDSEYLVRRDDWPTKREVSYDGLSIDQLIDLSYACLHPSPPSTWIMLWRNYFKSPVGDETMARHASPRSKAQVERDRQQCCAKPIVPCVEARRLFASSPVVEQTSESSQSWFTIQDSWRSKLRSRW